MLLIVVFNLFLISRVESYELEKIHTLAQENNEILKGDYDRNGKNKIPLQKDNLLAVIPEWGPNWKISFDLFIYSFDNTDLYGKPFEYASILRFTDEELSEEFTTTPYTTYTSPSPYENGDLGVGKRIPAIFTRNASNCDNCGYPEYTGIHYATNVDNRIGGPVPGNEYRDSKNDTIKINEWYSFEIEQNLEDFEWINRLKVRDEDGKVKFRVKLVVTTPNVYYNVSVFAGDKYFPAADATMKNLYFSP